MKITVDCNETQVNILVTALEEYFRTRMGQTCFLADNLAFDGFDYKNHEKEEFYKTIDKRGDMEAVLHKLATLLPCRSSDSCRAAADIWSCLRHEIFLHNGGSENDYSDVRSGKPMQLGPYLLPKITIEEPAEHTGEEEKRV